MYSDQVEKQQYRNRNSRSYENYSVFHFVCIRSECRRVQGVADRYTHYDSKNIDCPARLTAYTYKDDPKVYIHTKGEPHNHEAGHKFITLNNTTRNELRDQLRINQSTSVQVLLRQASSLGFDSEDKATQLHARIRQDIPRSQLIQASDLKYLRSGLMREKYELDKNENVSVSAWIRALGSSRVLHYCARVKGVTAFQLALTSWIGIDELDDWKGKPGPMVEAPISIDATFNVTKDPKMLLYTVIGRDSCGHGIPLAHLLTDSKTSEVLQVWLTKLRERFPQWQPKMILTDTASEQIKAIKAVFPATKMWLCSWHVYETFRREFRAVMTRKKDSESEYTHVRHHLLPALYSLLHEKKISNFTAYLKDFEALLDLWPANATNGLHRDDDQRRIAYLRKHYLREDSRHPPTEWAQCYRQDAWGGRQMDTTMLSESYHNILKNTLFQHKRRNNRMDYVIHVLMEDSVQWYSLKLKNQEAGRDRSLSKDTRSLNHAAFLRSIDISDSSIYWTSDTACLVKGSSSSYQITLPPTEREDRLAECLCNCSNYSFRAKASGSTMCKHIWAALRARQNNNQDAAELELAQTTSELAELYGLWDAELGSFVNVKREETDESHAYNSNSAIDFADTWEDDVELPTIDLVDSPMPIPTVPPPILTSGNAIDLPNTLLQHGFETSQIDTIVRLVNSHLQARNAQIQASCASQIEASSQLLASINSLTPITSGNRQNRLCDTETSKNMRPKITGKKRKATEAVGMSHYDLARLKQAIGGSPPPCVVID